MTAIPSPLSQAQLYVCTDAQGLSLKAFEDWASMVFDAGVDIIQLRDKRMEAAQELDYFAALRAAAARHGKLFSANDRADMALLAHAPILHLGQGDIPLPAARQLLGKDVLLGQSTHSVEQAQQAMQSVADYYCIGPVWPTPTKPGRPATGLDVVRQVAQAAQATSKPWFAIGGVDLETIESVVQAGATRVVVVRAITHAADPAEAARALKAKLPALG
ncbi:thiamine phosphate synthase [Lampropedia puyangensis]|uniref:Thiamine-phosphate synthase n=1 Tax=Lampropedia puyangensis TaxID=1330072 RepID=A0A4S8F050_9BURK|nr:thiamine phosphate synthase [Lampropedia puyangensis]THT99353.1 thiamine phosphate synthase [Lampropedia puyangensis]